jgi:GNAT superfamily N-acetyltransferase
VIDPLVRAAVQADAGELAALEAEARAALVDRRGGARWLDTHAARGTDWEATIATGGALVAHIDDVVVGYLVATVSDAIVGIDEVYVTPPARELGFGDALLAGAVEIGRAAGCELIEGEALPGDRDTKNLYERAGITARLITVSRRLV